MKKRIVFILSFISMLFLLTACGTNYSKTYQPSDIKIYTFNKGSNPETRAGYQVTKTINNKTTVNSVWDIIQHMKKEKSYNPPANSTPSRLCFDFSSSEKPNYDCFNLNENDNGLILTEVVGDSTGHHFKLSETNAEKIKKLYQ